MSRARIVFVATIPGLIVLVCQVVLLRAGDPFSPIGTYQALMNAAALGRFFGLFVAVIAVWGVLRGADAPRWALLLAVLSGPFVYAIAAILGIVGYYPAGEALYYGLNPLTLAGIGSQSGFAALAEMAWRWRRHRKVFTPGVLVTLLAGFAVLFVTVIFRGGVTWFFIYQRGYEVLFR